MLIVPNFQINNLKYMQLSTSNIIPVTEHDFTPCP